MTVIWVVSKASDPTPINALVKSCDVDAHRGQGSAEFTRRLENALRFVTHGDALQYWRRQSTIKPLRDDGRSNRPLTAFTVEIMSVEQAAEELRKTAGNERV